MSGTAPFSVDDVDAPALSRAVSHIAALGYREARVRELLALSDITDLRWRALPIYRGEQLAARDALASAVDLFLLQGAIPAIELDRIFDQADRDVLLRTGLLSIDEHGLVRALASLFPVGDRLVFSDHAWPKLPHPGCADIPYDQVMYVGSDSHWLARATVRRPVGAALDLCTGSGVHACLAALHARRVVAVDINHRAARCARFNVQASGTTNVEVAVGNLFEPVQGECFDLITANPPFVPSPVNTLGFRDGGRSGEDVQRRIVEGLPQHLAPGGIAQIVTELGEGDGEPIADRLRRWLGGAPMDILILRLRTHPATNYAIGHAQGDYDFGAFLDSVHDWAGNLKSQGYSRVVSVLLAFQWSDPVFGPPWTRSEETQPPMRDAGAEVEAIFHAERTARRPDLREALERGRVRLAGPIGLLEGRVLGSALRTDTQAQLLGQSLPIFQWLDPVEREVLVQVEKQSEVPDLTAIARGLDLDKESVLGALGSLLRRRLVMLA